MYTSFRVRNFRCFEDLKLENLERVNLIAGANNVGKTALLEALALHGGGYSPSIALRLETLRGFANGMADRMGHNDEAPWRSFFPHFDEAQVIELVGDDVAGKRCTIRLNSVGSEELRQIPEEQRRALEHVDSPDEKLKVLRLEYDGEGDGRSCYLVVSPGMTGVRTLSARPRFPVHFRAARRFTPNQELAERFGKMVKAGQQGRLVKALRIIEPRLERLETVFEFGEPVLHGDLGAGSVVSILDMGGGTVQLADLLLTVREAKQGVVLVDEFENGLHHSVLRKVWAAVAETARECDTQVFATTHSYECIAAAHRAFEESGTYDFRLHRLERIKGTINAITYRQETLGAALEMNLETR